MSWLKIDDRFEEHAKVLDLSDAAHRLWFRCACWCSQTVNEVTGGFVPTQRVIMFCGGSKAKAAKLAKELVDAKGPTQYGHEHGLWEPEQGGWRFHDWALYRPKAKSEDEQTALSAVRSQAGKRGAKSRWGDSKPDGKAMATLPPPEPSLDSKRDGSTDPVSRVPCPVAPPSVVEDPPAARKPTNLAQALTWGLEARAQLVLAEPHSAEWLQPQAWPELLRVVSALHVAAGLAPPKLGRYQADGAVRSAVELFAAGVTPESIIERIPRIVASEWWNRQRRDFGALTLVVWRRAELAEPTPRDEAAERRAKAAEERRRAEEQTRREIEARNRALDAKAADSEDTNPAISRARIAQLTREAV